MNKHESEVTSNEALLAPSPVPCPPRPKNQIFTKEQSSFFTIGTSGRFFRRCFSFGSSSRCSHLGNWTLLPRVSCGWDLWWWCGFFEALVSDTGAVWCWYRGRLTPGCSGTIAQLDRDTLSTLGSHLVNRHQQQYNLERLRFHRRGASIPLWVPQAGQPTSPWSTDYGGNSWTLILMPAIKHIWKKYKTKEKKKFFSQEK